MTNSNFSGRRKIIKDSSKFLAATVLAQGIGMIRGLMMPVLFNPAQLGIWNLMGVIIGYGGNATFGLVHGMNKAIPLLRGQGNEVGSEEVKDSVFLDDPVDSRFGCRYFRLLYDLGPGRVQTQYAHCCRCDFFATIFHLHLLVVTGRWPFLGWSSPRCWDPGGLFLLG